MQVPDSEGSSRLVVMSAEWGRATQYSIKDGYVCPDADSGEVTYDPWLHYAKDRAGVWRQAVIQGRKHDLAQAPYQSLLRLARSLPRHVSDLTSGDLDQILSWYHLNGPLGVLLHETVMVALPARYQFIVEAHDKTGRPDVSLMPVQMVYTKSSRGWWLERRRASVDRDDMDLSHVAHGDPVPAHIGIDAQPMMARIPLGRSSARIVHDSHVWLEHFPHCLGDPPQPGAWGFWQEFAESLEEFLAGAQLILEISSALAIAHSEQRDRRVVQTILPLVEQLARDVSPRPLFDPDTLELAIGWRSSSLLAAYVMMIVQDATTTGRLRACKNPKCRIPFASASASYCTPECASQHRQQRYRDRKRALMPSEQT